MCLSPYAKGDSPIFAAFAAKIGTVPVNGYPAPSPRSEACWSRW